MIITYTIKDYQLRETTKGKGIIKYTLINEDDEERIVSAVAKLGLGKKIKSIQPCFHREQPLVDALSNAQVNETITVDFTEYNDKHPRVPLDTNTIKELRRSKDADPFEGTLSNDFTSLINNKARLFQLLFGSIIIFIVLVFATREYF